MKIPLCFALIGCLLLAACASPPPPPLSLNRDRIARSITKGRTTKEQVLAEFGEPIRRSITEMTLPNVNADMMPFETWTYSRMRVRAYAPADVGVLIVMFNKKGVVTGYTFSGNN